MKSLKLLCCLILVLITSCSEEKATVIAQFNKTSLRFSSLETPNKITNKVNNIISSELSRLKKGENIQVFIKNYEIDTKREGDSITTWGGTGDPFIIIPNNKSFSVKQFASSLTPPEVLNWQFKTQTNLITFLKGEIIKELNRTVPIWNK
jgi:hypothetical protein